MSGGLHVEAAGHGPPLVLLHGWAMHSGVWAGLPAMLARGIACMRSTCRVTGEAPRNRPSLRQRSCGLWTRRSKPNAQAVTVLGWSLGGQLALAWALARPERIARLVLVGTTPRFVAGEGWDCAMSAATLTRFGDELHVSWRATVLRFLALQMRGSEHGHAALASLRRELFARGEPSRPVLRDALEVLAVTDLRADVVRIPVPALVIAGDRDTLAPAAAGRWLAAAMPGGHFVAIEGAAHVPFLSHPDEFGRAVTRFLDER